MLSGQKPFEGDSHVTIAAKLLSHDPKPVIEIVSSVPPDLSKIISRCLRKDLGRRYQHIDDVKVALEDVQEESGSAPQALVTRTAFRWRQASLLLVPVVRKNFVRPRRRILDSPRGSSIHLANEPMVQTMTRVAELNPRS
jgi:serine/threonine protein kinase